jgi:signal transduction histidine kinase
MKRTALRDAPGAGGGSSDREPAANAADARLDEATDTASTLHEIRAAERAERERLNIVVHELRSPLTVINGYLTMLDEGTVGALPERAASVVRTLIEQAARVSEVVDEILLAGRIDEGSVGRRTRPLLCVELLGRALARSSGHAALVGASVTCEAPRDLTVLADPESVDRILDNLVANALVHGGRAPSIALKAEADEGAVAIRVHDDGPGVPHELRDAVFERFVRGTDQTPGSGLGLYISRGLANLMGGDLVLEAPASGSGATFGLRLPIAR